MRILSWALLLILALSFPVCAAGPATRCVLMIKKVELKTSGGDWKTAFEGALPLDLAAEMPAAQFENKGRAPDGSYVNVRLTIDETVEITGFDGEDKTLRGGEIEIRGTASTLDGLPGDIQSLEEKSPTTNKAEAGPIRVTVDFDFADRDKTIELFSTRDFDKPFDVKAASKISILLSAKLEEAVIHVWPGYYNGFPPNDVMIFDFPKSFSDFSIRVDEFRSSAKGKIDIKF